MKGIVSMIILASNSPRRKELLKLITDDFSVKPARVEETVEADIPLFEYPKYLARKKADYVFKNGHLNDTVIGCDTGVFAENVMLGKPKNSDDAIKMLKMLSGKTHKVITGCCIITKEKEVAFSQTSEVEFYPLTNFEIENYINTGEPYDKAGGYGIQGKGALLVRQICSDYFNIVGLPVALLNRRLREFR